MTPTKGAAKQAADTSSLEARLAELEAENAQLKAKVSLSGRAIVAKPSKKGALSIYGLGRMPVTLYPSQWSVLMDQAKMVENAIRIGTELGAFSERGKTVDRSDEELELIRAAFSAKMAQA